VAGPGSRRAYRRWTKFCAYPRHAQTASSDMAPAPANSAKYDASCTCDRDTHTHTQRLSERLHIPSSQLHNHTKLIAHCLTTFVMLCTLRLPTFAPANRIRALKKSMAMRSTSDMYSRMPAEAPLKAPLTISAAGDEAE